MAKSVADVVLDAAFDMISSHAQKIAVCAGVPADTTAADTGGANCLAVTTISSGSFAVADSSVSGRKLTVAQMATIAVSATGVADHIALFSTGASAVLYYVTECATQALPSTANTVTINSWTIRIADPT